jgi:hypothetical protein
LYGWIRFLLFLVGGGVPGRRDGMDKVLKGKAFDMIEIKYKMGFM